MSKSAAWIKKTLKLPKTSFPPRPNVAEQPALLKKCSDDLYAWQRANRVDSSTYTLHDGPPYANGDLHIGHALNKILKDITCRYQLAQGKRVTFVPGWDCHGLPIELKALETDTEQKEGKHVEGEEHPEVREAAGLEGGNATTKALRVRKLARKLAFATVEKQKKQFREWGIMADWSNAWRTMDKGFKLEQLKVFKKMVGKGLIYRRFKPVYWSPSTRTALAEAELEYHDEHKSTAAYVGYPLASVPVGLTRDFGDWDQVSCVIWTTMPWTLPANRAIGFNTNLYYAVVQSEYHGLMLVAASRIKELESRFKVEMEVLLTLKGEGLEGATYHDPLWSNERPERPLLAADHVTEDSGSGLAHLAPGHGPEDYRLCLKHGIPPFTPVDEQGRFDHNACPDQPDLLTGQDVMHRGNEAVLERVADKGLLIERHEYRHKYPYDWRSKQPVLLRATAQWFANVGDLQQKALAALDQSDIKFTPEGGKNRLMSMVEKRSEWCISRQRAWGVSIPALFHKDSHDVLMTEESLDHIISVSESRDKDAWWSDAEDDPVWTPPSFRSADGTSPYRRGTDTMDVWFDSGSSWTQTTDAHGNEQMADIYLEGSDQHRGWFQSSLLTYTASQNLAAQESKPNAPFRSLVTHGFVLDKYGRKMSKSEGNVIAPSDIIDGTLMPVVNKKVKGKPVEIQERLGPDALRLWVASSDFTRDVTVSVEKLKIVQDTLVKLRVTFKQLLGVLDGYGVESTYIQEHGALHHALASWHLQKMQASVIEHYKAFEYNRVVDAITKYVSTDLSSFYFETIKDAAYCGTRAERQAVQTTSATILTVLMRLTAPILPILVQEVWQHVPEQLGKGPVRDPFKDPLEDEIIGAAGVHVDQLDEDVPHLMALFEAVDKTQERARNDKRMGSSLECNVTLHTMEVGSEEGRISPTALFLKRYAQDFAKCMVVSKVDVVLKGECVPSTGWHYTTDIELLGQKVNVQVCNPQGEKCVRCWRYLAPPSEPPESRLCGRCKEVIGAEELGEERHRDLPGREE